MAIVIQTEAYAIEQSVSPPNLSGNYGLNPCESGGFMPPYPVDQYKSEAPIIEVGGLTCSSDR